MGQELHSCDTTQIDALRPLASRAITRARWITGGSPSASTWLPVQAALESPFTRPRPVLIPPPRTLFGFAAPATTLSHRFVCCSVVGAIIAAPIPFVKSNFFSVLKKILAVSTIFPSGKGKGRAEARPFMRANYSLMPMTTPEPTVRPPSRMAKRRPFSMAMGVISSTSMSTLSPGMHISVPSGRVMMPVTSVVRK